MRYNVITYLLGEGIRNVFKNKKSTSASIIIMSLTMLIFGVFFVITQNINSIMKQIESEQGIEVFLYDISEDQTKALEDYIRNIDGINTVEYKSKEDALNVLNKTYDALEDNGLFVFNVMNREGKAVDEEWVDFPNEYHMGADRYYKYFKEEEMNEIIKQTGFEVCDFHKEGGVNNNKWLVYVLKK